MNQIPVTALTGYLGAVKTTLLNRIVAEEQSTRRRYTLLSTSQPVVLIRSGLGSDARFGGALDFLSETCRRLRPITSGSVMSAITRRVPPQKGHVVTMSFPLGIC